MVDRRPRVQRDSSRFRREKTALMRIIAGKYRRRRLLANPGETTRPITDFAKETLFEHIHECVVGKRVADVFAGTGTIGLETLSRGAASVMFFERDHKAFELLRKNVDSIGASEDAFCWRVDVLRTSFRPKGVDRFLPFDVVFFDPPYAMMPELQENSALYKSLVRLARESVTSCGARLIVRAPKRTEFDMPAVWEPEFALDISGMTMHVYRKGDVEARAVTVDAAAPE